MLRWSFSFYSLQRFGRIGQFVHATRNISKKFDLIKFIQTNTHAFERYVKAVQFSAAVGLVWLFDSNEHSSNNNTNMKEMTVSVECVTFFYHHQHQRFLSPLQITSTSHTDPFNSIKNFLSNSSICNSIIKRTISSFVFFLLLLLLSLSVCLGKYSVL